MGIDIRKIIKEVLNEIDWEGDFSDVKQVCMKTEDVVDYLNKVRANAPLDTKDREKFSKDKPYVHAKSTFFKKGETIVSIDDFIKNITTPPNSIISSNEKIMKSGGPHEYVFNTGIPALKGIVYDEDKNTFHYVNTCPGAGSCALVCYATKGNYIRYPQAYDGMTRRLNYLMNHPAEYEEQMYNEIKDKAEEFKAFEGYKAKIIIRWNDSGDFFTQKYVDIADSVINRLKEDGYNVDSYAYTKVADVAKDAGFDTTFSVGANKRQEKQMDLTKHKKSMIVPKDLFKDLDFNRIADEAKLKERVAKFFNLNKNYVISYDDLLTIPKGDVPKWSVIVVPGDGDDAAFRKDVDTILLTFH